ncbi:hypothetical protein PV328_011950, partial [Microctonus aethiopoides]
GQSHGVRPLVEIIRSGFDFHRTMTNCLSTLQFNINFGQTLLNFKYLIYCGQVLASQVHILDYYKILGFCVQISNLRFSHEISGIVKNKEGHVDAMLFRRWVE